MQLHVKREIPFSIYIKHPDTDNQNEVHIGAMHYAIVEILSRDGDDDKEGSTCGDVQ